jgi:hypothetical protein
MAFLAAIPAALGGMFSGVTAGGALSAIGSVVSGIAGLSAGMYQANVAKMNQKVAEENAVRALDRSQEEQREQDMQTMAMIGQQEAVQSASGTTTTGRSNLLTRRVAARLGRQDAANVREAGRMEAYGYNVDAANFGGEASMARRSGVNSLVSGFFDAGSSLIGGSKTKAASRFRDSWVTSSGTSLRRVNV